MDIKDTRMAKKKAEDDAPALEVIEELLEFEVDQGEPEVEVVTLEAPPVPAVKPSRPGRPLPKGATLNMRAKHARG